MSIRSLLRHVGVNVGPLITVGGKAVDHEYLSTSCLHARETGREELHDYCKGMTGMAGAKRPAECKFCGAKCICPCHTSTDLEEGAPEFKGAPRTLKTTRCRYCPDPLCPEDCPECGGPIHDLDAVRPLSSVRLDPAYFTPEGGPVLHDCPTCGPVTLERHPRLPVMRCSNCKEHAGSGDGEPADRVRTADCRRCGGVIGWIDCPTGGWWSHRVHPRDDHDAEPSGPGACIAWRIRAELVCCHIFDRVNDTHELTIRQAMDSRDWHDLCYWGEAAARLAEDFDREHGDTVSVPRDALRRLVEVAMWVSRGRSMAFVPDDSAAVGRVYPDAKARRALGALDDAGLLEQFREGS